MFGQIIFTAAMKVAVEAFEGLGSRMFSDVTIQIFLLTTTVLAGGATVLFVLRRVPQSTDASSGRGLNSRSFRSLGGRLIFRAPSAFVRQPPLVGIRGRDSSSVEVFFFGLEFVFVLPVGGRNQIVPVAVRFDVIVSVFFSAESTVTHRATERVFPVVVEIDVLAYVGSIFGFVETVIALDRLSFFRVFG